MSKGFARLIAWRGIACRAGCLAVVAAAALAGAQETQDAKPKVSSKPLTSEQLAVYRAVLSNWMANEMSDMNLAIQTVPIEAKGPEGDEGCAKGLDLEAASPGIVHRFRQEDLAQLGAGRTFTLVDPERQKKEVENNDPEKTIRNGSSIDEAVRNGFAHGLATVSEIQFDKKHMTAIVSYGFYCGSLCGNGGTVVLEKKDGAWQRRSHCHDWISREALPHFPRGHANPA